ncbi:hypothetical protein ACPW96_03365 [Micromonospora sp. DT81.3]|uniref:hypothetical protein n=1 Tax=Actinomycetes TaxID=1760 RepID=UPI003CF8C78B
MLELHYTGDRILMADAIGEAVMRYASALAEAKTSDVIVVPVIDDKGQPSQAELLIGPASQLYSTPAPDADEVGADPAVIAELDRRARRLLPSLAQPVERSESSSYFDPDMA